MSAADRDEAGPGRHDSEPKNDESKYVSRGGLKLEHALREFAIDARGLICADLGSNVGGFVDCLIQGGAERVYAVDTGYGTLAWTLRKNPRVVVMERTNALHAEPVERVDLVTIDLGWTPQRLALPAGRAWLKEGGSIVTLIKPHYETRAEEKGLLRDGVLPEEDAARIAERTIEEIGEMGLRVVGVCRSPILGGKGRKGGNAEWLARVAV